MTNVAEKSTVQSASFGEHEIVEHIYDAVIEQQLRPGTKLSELSLCEAFGVGRMRIRSALLLLASRNIVDLQSNRGAYISTPTLEQARQVFEARRAIEPNICRLAVERATENQIVSLEDHLEDERNAQTNGDRRQAIRLSGRFHVMLAEIAVNQVMERMVKELVTRTSLIIGMFGASGTANCHEDEHSLLLQAFKEGRQDEAAQLMVTHLNHIEQQIDLTSDRRESVDLVELFKN